MAAAILGMLGNVVGANPVDYTTRFERPDGVEVGLRPSSLSGGRTIDIRTPGQKDRRIHVK